MKFSEKLNRLMNEAEEVSNDINSLIRQELKEYGEEDLLEGIRPISSSSLEDLAEANGYKVYGGDGFDDNALVIDVKGRPDITNQKVDEFLQSHPDELQWAIDDFADGCRDDISGFTIRGRMGGYWGLSNLDDNITITETGYDSMVNKVNEFLNDPELYKSELEETQTEEDLKSLIYDVIQYNTTEIANTLIENDNALDIKPEFLEKMNELKDRIDAQEQAWNDPENWEHAMANHQEENSLEEDYDDEADEYADFFDDESFIDNTKEDKILSDEDIAAQYNDFKVESCTIEPSSVHDEWFNATLEIEFPNADHPDFNSSVIENVYYDRAADNWGFDNWYPDETIEKLKSLTSGTAMVFGVAFKLPLITKLDLPDPMPKSTSLDVKNVWYSERCFG